jgi:hypothetical protein
VVGEAELLEEDGGAGVVLEGVLLDLRRCRGEVRRRDGDEEEEERAGGGHRGEIWVRKKGGGREVRESGEGEGEVETFLMRGFGRWVRVRAPSDPR